MCKFVTLPNKLNKQINYFWLLKPKFLAVSLLAFGIKRLKFSNQNQLIRSFMSTRIGLERRSLKHKLTFLIKKQTHSHEFGCAYDGLGERGLLQRCQAQITDFHLTTLAGHEHVVAL